MIHSFEDICRIEPRVRQLLVSIPERMRSDEGFWRNWSGIKMAMCELVGFDSGNHELGSCGDYDTAYHALLDEANRCEDIEELLREDAEEIEQPV